MVETQDRAYWLFQAHPKKLHLVDALRANALHSFWVKAHKDKIHAGDKVILWQTGKKSGVYALATVRSEPRQVELGEEESNYWLEAGPTERVKLKVDYNLWNRPIDPNTLKGLPPFEDFNAGLSGTNYMATEEQFSYLEGILQETNALEEPQPEYLLRTWLNPPHNLVLYGPPGTGKTYQTVNHALSIIENRTLEELAMEDRMALRKRFNQYMGQGQIAFLTFHQSFAYEDFIEGIKPVVHEGKVTYEVQDGIFKIMCDDARRCLLETLVNAHALPTQELKFGQLFSAFLQYIKGEDFTFFSTPKKRRIFLHRVLKFGNLSVRMEKSFSTLTVYKDRLRKLYQTYPHPEMIQSIEDIQSLVGSEPPRVYLAIFLALKNFEADLLHQLELLASINPSGEDTSAFEFPLITESMLAQCRKYVIIIDEINRANLSAVFGELITLLESDKREGGPESLSTLLPYSKTYFSIPPNLYLIGTMNTADRSAESWDLALRRRFIFKELDADPALIPKLLHPPMVAGIDLKRLLETINARLGRLLDRDYKIGHAFFLNIHSLAELKSAFSLAIIPLLREFFFDDLGKLGLVLGPQFVRIERQQEEDFAEFDYPYLSEFIHQPQYELQSIEDLKELDFIRIYDKNYQA
ncbi:MAG: EVE domain-containing protein [Saprospiraceae bacterium]|nr:EVE domain-containing protein [Saprospiraceae bacterium]